VSSSTSCKLAEVGREVGAGSVRCGACVGAEEVFIDDSAWPESPEIGCLTADTRCHCDETLTAAKPCKTAGGASIEIRLRLSSSLCDGC
jgi:hypothetical protein